MTLPARRQLNAPFSSSSRVRSTFGAWCCQTIWIPWNSFRHAGETRCARSSMMLSRSWISFSGNLPSAAMLPLPPGAPRRSTRRVALSIPCGRAISSIRTICRSPTGCAWMWIRCVQLLRRSSVPSAPRSRPLDAASRRANPLVLLLCGTARLPPRQGELGGALAPRGRCQLFAMAAKTSMCRMTTYRLMPTRA